MCPRYTAMVMSRRSADQTTLFSGRSRPTKRLTRATLYMHVHILSPVADNCCS